MIYLLDKMVIGVVGNRTGWTYEEVEKELDKLDIKKNYDYIVSGGASGVDTHAQGYAQKLGIPFIIFYPDPGLESPERYFRRNREIVEASDFIIAFQEDTTHSGTQYTINRAREKGVRFKVIMK